MEVQVPPYLELYSDDVPNSYTRTDCDLVRVTTDMTIHDNMVLKAERERENTLVQLNNIMT